MKNNILQVFGQSGALDREDGLAWYSKARSFVYQRAEWYDADPQVVTAVLASLSPRNRWEQNLRDVDTVFKAAPSRLGSHDLKCGTFYGNVDKALKIARTGNLSLLTGPKVLAFLSNILDEDSMNVTVDVWAMRIALYTSDWTKTISPTEYYRVEEQYQLAAVEAGLRPYELQAITWVYARRVVSKGLGFEQPALL